MDFKLGEFVRFVDEKREGYITTIIDEIMVGVTGDDDFEIPTTVKNLTRVHGHSNYKQTAVAKVEPTQIILENFIENGILLAVSPDLNKASIAHFYLVNNTNYQLYCTLNSEKANLLRGEFADTIMPLSTKKVYVASLPELDNWPKLIFRIISYTPLNKPCKAPILTNINFKAKDFSGAKSSISLLPKPVWLINLDEDFKIDAQKLKESFFKLKAELPSIEIPDKEVDLHIEKLNPAFAGLTNVEIIEQQLNFFNKSIDAAIFHRFKTIIFIHGVGNGTLKALIHKQLGKHPQVKTFMDAYKEKFGFGATQVVFK
ncbi:MAG: DNA mismatch repair protein MutS [Sphingobacteriales bacterium]|nr:MAG: DNA mismatch repair protein MutS [Sphingobacteriales bacterium]